MKRTTERRKHNRFKVKEGVFAMIMPAPAKLERIKDMSMGEIALAVLKARPVQMGRIVNIGKGGLAFCYIDDKERSNELSELCILSSRDAFYLKSVPFRTVSDFITVSTFSSGTFEMKQKGVQFGELMPNQLSELDFFIRNHTTGKV